MKYASLTGSNRVVGAWSGATQLLDGTSPNMTRNPTSTKQVARAEVVVLAYGNPGPLYGTAPNENRLFRTAKSVHVGNLDGDNVTNATDNCIELPNNDSANGMQADTDGDLCGNACDGDLNNSGDTTIVDFNLFKACYGKNVGPSAGGPADDPTCGESDMNASGAVTIVDLNLFKAEMDTKPGPSGTGSYYTGPCRR